MKSAQKTPTRDPTEVLVVTGALPEWRADVTTKNVPAAAPAGRLCGEET